MTIEEEKRLFRKSALKRRAEITNRQEKSAQIAKNLFDTKAYKNASMIFAYMAYRSEADTMPVIEHALAEQKCCCSKGSPFGWREGKRQDGVLPYYVIR